MDHQSFSEVETGEGFEVLERVVYVDASISRGVDDLMLVLLVRVGVNYYLYSQDFSYQLNLTLIGELTLSDFLIALLFVSFLSKAIYAHDFP